MRRTWRGATGGNAVGRLEEGGRLLPFGLARNERGRSRPGKCSRSRVFAAPQGTGGALTAARVRTGFRGGTGRRIVEAGRAYRRKTVVPAAGRGAMRKPFRFSPQLPDSAGRSPFPPGPHFRRIRRNRAVRPQNGAAPHASSGHVLRFRGRRSVHAPSINRHTPSGSASTRRTTSPRSRAGASVTELNGAKRVQPVEAESAVAAPPRLLQQARETVRCASRPEARAMPWRNARSDRVARCRPPRLPQPRVRHPQRRTESSSHPSPPFRSRPRSPFYRSAGPIVRRSPDARKSGASTGKSPSRTRSAGSLP